jgi:acyl carrier protein
VIDWAEINSLDPQLIERIYRLLFPDPILTIGDKDNQEAIALNPTQDSPAKPQDVPAIEVIREVVIQVLKLKSIDDNRKFQDYGLDSISATQLAIKLEHQLKREILPKWLIDYPTITLLAQHLIGDKV